MKCWAVDAVGASQVAFNHLYGNAMIIDTVHGAAFEYNAWAFTARGVAQGAAVGTGGTLVLSGATGAYDACPQYLAFNFFSVGSSINLPEEGGNATFVNTDLTLVPCIQDLRQDRVPTCTKAKFDIWNENETKYTGAYQCFKCWFEGYLDNDSKPVAKSSCIRTSIPRPAASASRVYRAPCATSAPYISVSARADRLKPRCSV